MMTACGSSLTHVSDGLDEGEVVGDDLSKLGEVPAVPLACPHHVVVQLLVEVVEQRDRLDDHCVNLVWTELEFVPR